MKYPIYILSNNIKADKRLLSLIKSQTPSRDTSILEERIEQMEKSIRILRNYGLSMKWEDN